MMTMFEQKTTLEKERQELRKQLDSQLAKANINFEEETQKRVAEALAKVKDQNEKARSDMEEFLKTKIEKNVSLEMQLDELRDAYLALEQSLSGEDKTLQ